VTRHIRRRPDPHTCGPGRGARARRLDAVGDRAGAGHEEAASRSRPAAHLGRSGAAERGRWPAGPLAAALDLEARAAVWGKRRERE